MSGLSNCHKAPMTVSGSGDFSEHDVCTQYYVCTKCGEPADIYVESKLLTNGELREALQESLLFAISVSSVTPNAIGSMHIEISDDALDKSLNLFQSQLALREKQLLVRIWSGDLGKYNTVKKTVEAIMRETAIVENQERYTIRDHLSQEVDDTAKKQAVYSGHNMNAYQRAYGEAASQRNHAKLAQDQPKGDIK